MFLFALSATHLGQTALLRVPEELEDFCRILDVPFVDLPNWYAEFDLPDPNRRTNREEPMDAQATRYRQRRSPSTSRTNLLALRRLRNHVEHVATIDLATNLYHPGPSVEYHYLCFLHFTALSGSSPLITHRHSTSTFPPCSTC